MRRDGILAKKNRSEDGKGGCALSRVQDGDEKTVKLSRQELDRGAPSVLDIYPVFCSLIFIVV